MNRKTNMLENYEAPALTVVTVKAERGYAISSAILKSEAETLWFEYGSSDPYVTEYTDDDSWDSYSWSK